MRDQPAAGLVLPLTVQSLVAKLAYGTPRRLGLRLPFSQPLEQALFLPAEIRVFEHLEVVFEQSFIHTANRCKALL